MKDTFGVDSCRLYKRCVEGIGSSSVCDKNVLLSDSLPLCSTLALSPDANSKATSFTAVPTSLASLYSRGDDSEATGMLAPLSSAFKTGSYNTQNAFNYVHETTVNIYIILEKYQSNSKTLHMQSTEIKISQNVRRLQIP